MTDAASFAKFVPGFDFLQSLSKSNASTLPGVSSWVAPTLDPEELDKRITDLKAVLFWLEQNTTALKATIQALEVQKMTLATLKGMNMDMSAMAKAFKFPDFSAVATPAPSAQPRTSEPQAAAPAPQETEPTAPAPSKARAEPRAKAKPAPAKPVSVVDPLQLWGSLTQQFQQIASEALQEVTKQAVPPKAGQATASAKTTRASTDTAAKPSPRASSKTSARATKKVAKTPASKRAAGRKA